MSSLQSLRELISERLAAAAEEICRLCEGTIVQYEQELCRQRRLLDVIWKPQLQLHHIVLPQHWVTEDEDLCNRQRNVRVELEKPDPPHNKEEPKEPEPSPIKKEQEGFYNSQLDLKQETDTLMEIPTYEEDESSEADLNNQQKNFRVEPEEAEPPQIKKESEEPEPPQIKEEPGELCIGQDEDHLNLKQETDALMEIPTNEENENSEADLNNQQSFNVTDCQDEEANQHEESTSAADEKTESTPTTDEETDPQNRDQRKRRGRSLVQNLDSSHMSESERYSDGSRKDDLVKKRKESSKQKTLSSFKAGENSRIAKKPQNVRFHTVEKRFSCNECDKSYGQLCHLQRHMRIHTRENLFSCKECDKSFIQLYDLQKHMRTHTGEKPFSCPECAERFSQISSLKKHMRIHTGEKPFSCKECNKGFSDSSDLKQHMRTHTGEKPFSCKECNKSFNRTFHLKTHMRTHTGEKPFFCKECYKSFKRISNLKIHMRTHTGEKPFSCKECNKSFSQSNCLKIHMRTHNREKQFKTF
ncbi:uncharacterized protein LOC144987639 [Oryzias latipes]